MTRRPTLPFLRYTCRPHECQHSTLSLHCPRSVRVKKKCSTGSSGGGRRGEPFVQWPGDLHCSLPSGRERHFSDSPRKRQTNKWVTFKVGGQQRRDGEVPKRRLALSSLKQIDSSPASAGAFCTRCCSCTTEQMCKAGGEQAQMRRVRRRSVVKSPWAHAGSAGLLSNPWSAKPRDSRTCSVVHDGC
jgi:hypothetical protein